MNHTRLEWVSSDSLPKGCIVLFGLPGLGNVGKLVVDGVIEKMEEKLLVRLYHPDFPPHAILDDDGLLTPPCITIHSVTLPSGNDILVIGGLSQPLTPTGQFDVAEKLLDLFAMSEVEFLLVLAGLSAEPKIQEVHLICSDSNVRQNLESNGLKVDRKNPSAGMIGLPALLLSLSLWKQVPSAGMVATTVGATVDPHAAQRLVERLKKDFSLDIPLSLKSTEDIADRLERLFEDDEVAEVGFEAAPEDLGFYQ